MTTIVSPALISDHILHVRDEKASGTAGGSFTSGAWRTRDLNTTKTNTITGASLSSNQVTLPAGTYIATWGGCASRIQRHQSRLYNITDSTAIAYGENMRASDSVNVDNWSKGNIVFTITGTKVIEVQHRSELTTTPDGFGTANSFGGVEVYVDLFITKIG